MYRYAHGDGRLSVPARREAHCFSPIRRDPLSIASSSKYLAAIGTSGAGQRIIAVAELTPEGDVETWHSIPYPSEFDAPVAVTVRETWLRLLASDGEELALLRFGMKSGRPSRSWTTEAAQAVSGDVLGGAIASQMAFSLVNRPGERDRVAVLASRLGERAQFRPVAELPWSGGDMGMTTLGPEVVVLEQAVGLAEGRLSRAPIGEADLARSWVTGPSGLTESGREMLCRNIRGRVTGVFYDRDSGTPGSSGVWHTHSARLG